MCKVCESEEALISIDISYLFKQSNFKFAVLGDKIYLAEDNKLNIEMYWKINYCPICGKKLKKD